MSSFTVETTIAAPPERVWQALADIGAIARWNPGVVASHTTGDRPGGLDAERYCDLGGGNYLHERVVAWEPERALTMRITETNLPFAAADIAFTLEPAPNGGRADAAPHSRVTLTPTYRLRFGPLGRLLDAVYVRSQYRRGMAALLDGLRREVEGDPPV